MDASLFQRLSKAERGLANRDTWKPEPGDCLAGLIIRTEYVDGKFGSQLLLEVISIKDFSVCTVWPSTLLVRALESMQVRAGDEIALKYLGLAPDHKTKNFALWLEKHGQRAGRQVAERAKVEPPVSPDNGRGTVIDDGIPF